MKGQGVPLTGRIPLWPEIVFPEAIFTQGAQDHKEPKSLKSPSWSRRMTPAWATAPGAAVKVKKPMLVSMLGPITAIGALRPAKARW